MKRIWKSLLGIALVVAVSAGAVIATNRYLTSKRQVESSGTVTMDSEYGFQQPARLASYSAALAGEIDFSVAAESAVHAVVHIKSTTKERSSTQYIDPFEYFFGFGNRGYQRQPQLRVGFGSGVIISADGYIVTNNHVIEGADELEVTLNDGRKFVAKSVGADPTTDIALVKIESKNLPTIPFGDSDKLKVGEWVLAVGNPFNLTSTVTAGIVSAKGRGVFAGGTGTRNRIASYIQTDAAVNPGNSGGALVNTKGELVGINTMILSETGNFAGYSFAVPVSIVSKVVADLKQYGTVQRAMLGVSIIDVKSLPDDRKSGVKVLEGAYVEDFSAQSSAKSAGIEKGDVITEINDVRVKSANELQEKVSRFRPGNRIKVTVNRNGATKTFTVELRNMQGNTEVTTGPTDTGELLGATFKALSNERKQQLGIAYGIEVTAVFNGKFKEAGVPKGFIIMLANDRRIATPDELEQTVDKIIAGGGDEQLLVIKGLTPDRRTRYYAINLSN